MTAKILEALSKLDPKNDAHWTSDGLPRLETVKLFAGDSNLSREAVTAAAPGFSRANNALQTASTDPAATAPAAPPVQGVVTKSEGGDDAADTTGDGSSVLQTEPEGAGEQDPLSVAHDRLAEAEARKAQADQEYQAAVSAVDKILDERAAAGGGETLAQQVSSYHQRQLDILNQRAAHKKALAESGIKLADLLPSRAKLDAAFDRKTARGSQRPNIPVRR